MAYDPRAVANFFLDQAESDSILLTNMSLLKLVFFAQGWHLAVYGTNLVDEKFRAWPNGPVVQSVYQQFKKFGDRPITSRAIEFSFESRLSNQVQYKFPNELVHFLSTVYRMYSNYSAFQLSDLTHQQGSPWDIVWKRVGSHVKPGMEISNDEIRRFFQNKNGRFVQH